MTSYLGRQVGIGFIAAVLLVINAANVIRTQPIAGVVIIVLAMLMFAQIIRLAKKLDNTREGIRMVADKFDQRLKEGPQ